MTRRSMRMSRVRGLRPRHGPPVNLYRWAAQPARRMALLSRCMTEEGESWGPQRLFKGYEAISEKIEGFHSRIPGARLVLASGLNIFLNVARFKVAIVNADGSTRSEGDNFIEMAESDRIHRVFPFWEPVPPIPV
jgi:hypothetical protein